MTTLAVQVTSDAGADAHPAPPLPADGLLAVYPAPGAAFELRRLPLPAPQAGEALLRVRLCTICRSDIHTWQGHRAGPLPGVLGHEIIGSIAALGVGLTQDMRGQPLRVGDRVTFSEYFQPGHDADLSDAAALADMPHKVAGTLKYGHLGLDTPPRHHGGFGEYCLLAPRTWILRVPDALSDEEAAPLNCGVATAVCLVEHAALQLGETVVVVGLGALGLYAAAVARARGAGRVIGVDREPARRRLALAFGCDTVLDAADPDLVAAARSASPAHGADAVIEACGDPAAVPAALAMLRLGGRCIVGGLVNPGAALTLDGHLLLRQGLTLRGVHNYHPRHLAQALDFMLAHRDRFPFRDLVQGRYPLADLDRAMRDAHERRVLRAAVLP